MTDLSKILAILPQGLRTPLVVSYQQIVKNFAEHRWEPAELNGGKFSEIVYTIIDGHIKGKFPAKPSKPKDMVRACRDLEKQQIDFNRVGDQSLRILIPRMLLPLYEIRNNRGVGHAGGDVDPNFLDSTAVYGMTSWIFAELIRIFHNITTIEAQEIVNALVERKHPLIWEVEGTKRILEPSMPKKDQVLMLLYAEPSWVTEEELIVWVEYTNPSTFRKLILEPLHKSRLIEYDKQQKRMRISPRGLKEVEQRILKDGTLL